MLSLTGVGEKSEILMQQIRQDEVSYCFTLGDLVTAAKNSPACAAGSPEVLVPSLGWQDALATLSSNCTENPMDSQVMQQRVGHA